MENTLALEESWDILVRMFPPNWRSLAKETNAVVRKLRNFKDEESVIRILLLHLANGYSLRETVTRAKAAKLVDITDVALLKRLQCSEYWLKELSLCLLRERGVRTTTENKCIQIRLVDGTIVKEPGRTGSQWRIHYCVKLPDLECDFFKLTEACGQGTGESFKQFPVRSGDCIIGDRAYSTVQGIAYLAEKSAFSLVRVNTSALIFYAMDEEKFKLLEKVMTLEQEYQIGEWNVKVNDTDQGFIKGRLCVIRKSIASAEKAIAKLKKQAKKRQRVIKKETLEFAKYIIIFTTLPSEQFSVNKILEWYRFRWQIELVFKRLKSLASLGHLPKYDDQSSRAWLYGKLFVALLIEKVLCYAEALSPWGYTLPWENQEPLERI